MNSWIDQLRPIIKEYKDGDDSPLTPEEVERIALIIRFKIDKEEAEDAAESSAYGGAGQYCFDDYEFEMDAELQTDDLKEVKEAWIEQFGDEDVDEMFTRG